MKHSKTCYLGGYRGPTKCCSGKCLHKINCNCPGGETIDRAYIEERIRSLDSEREMWKERLMALPLRKTMPLGV